ncbi:MAG: histidine phosphatase family protein [Lachnospiraceae bacterium]|nr:histidine phosphatase family protein [Lachnospiraceae bacterium]
MRLYIIRHGQTEWNSSYRLQGRTDVPLNENGRDLARKTGEGLTRAGVCFDRIYTSPLSRARETAELAAGSNIAKCKAQGTVKTETEPETAFACDSQDFADGHLHKSVPIITEPRIQEISFGIMEGERVRDENGVLNVDNFINFFNDPERYVPPAGGESFQELIARTGDFLEELRTEALKLAYEKEQNILISTHGAASRALLANITHCALRDYWSGGVPKNCAVTIADFADGVWKIAEQDRIFYE